MTGSSPTHCSSSIHVAGLWASQLAPRGRKKLCRLVWHLKAPGLKEAPQWSQGMWECWQQSWMLSLQLDATQSIFLGPACLEGQCVEAQLGRT